MKFSIIIPLYNKAAYVEKALRSVFAQTFTDYELIVVDDGSTDNSLQVAKRLLDEASQNLSPFTFHLLTQKNAGVGAARNKGVAESSGEYLCFLDADDWWEPTFLEEMAKFVEEYPGAGIYASNYTYFKPGKTHVAVNHPSGDINYPKLYFDNGAMPIWTGAVCMPQKSFDKYGGFPTGIKLGEDFLLWSKIAVENKVAFLNKPLAYYNNDIPSNMRATRNLHNPKYHMLFNMQWLENRVSAMEDNEDWINLIDKLRVDGLLEYWLSKDYHDIAAEELEKVDWSKQPKSIIRKYQMPKWVMKMINKAMTVGSKIKKMIL